jgi:hypothetical protein
MPAGAIRHELREKGATDEQYQRAVDRLLEDR